MTKYFKKKYCGVDELAKSPGFDPGGKNTIGGSSPPPIAKNNQT